MLTGGIYPGMITATVGTVLLVAVVVSSIVVVRRHVRYEAWYAIHLTVYAAIALAWFHQIPTGNELVVDRLAADYWRGLYVVTLLLLVGFRVAVPAVNAFRYRLRVVEVVDEGAGAVSLHIGGRGVSTACARRRGSSSSGASSHAAAGGPRTRSRSPRPRTAARCGSRSRTSATSPSRAGSIPVGTRVVAEGPFGVFTDAVRRRPKVALIGGGVGITPVRALLEEMDGDIAVVYRVISEDDVIFGEELQALAARKGAALHVVAGDHRTDAGREPALAGTPAGARPRHRRARRLRLRAAGDGRCRPRQRSREPASPPATSTPSASRSETHRSPIT